MWLRPGLFPNEPVDRAWDNDACTEDRGFFQILVCYRPRPKMGQIEPSLLADALISHFTKGTELGPVRVKKRPHQSPAVVYDASESFIPVTVYYLGSLPKPEPVIPANVVMSGGLYVVHEGAFVVDTP